MRLAGCLAATVLLLAAGRAGAGDWNFAGLTLAGFDGFTEEAPQYPRQLHHADGTEVLVSVFRASGEAEAQMFGADPEKRVASHEQGAWRVYQQLAVENEPAIPLGREPLMDGSTLVSGALKKTGVLQPGFFLMYMVIAPAERVAFVTVEGEGDPQAAYKRYRPVFDTVKWEP
jgi:hypothetical protein